MARKILTVKLYVSELLYDVKNKTYVTGRSRSTGSNPEEVANMQANDDDESLNQLLRSFGSSFAMLKSRLGEYVDESGTSSDNIQLTDETELTLSLSMPSNYNEGTREAISASMHQYIVDRAVGEWLTMTDKADAKDYFDFAASDLANLRDAINKRVRPVRRSITTSEEKS